MKLLLDTHTLFWWDMSPDQLSKQVLDLLSDEANTLMVSVASVWEMQIKQQLGKLALKLSLADMIQNQRDKNGITLVSVRFLHVLELDQLPLYHRDPFDRILIAQSRVEEAILVSRDTIFEQYDVRTIW